ncbi:hypothetical protein M8J76_000406 [Diaphorina citri]|nr:hypothetical protein M8J75_004626 [Diaphorina citri]KAI5736145.1 hypothetical protein M8J76_000406 [Diaphorina citri]
MSKIIQSVEIYRVGKSLEQLSDIGRNVILVIDYDPQGMFVSFKQHNSPDAPTILEITITPKSDCVKIGTEGYLFSHERDTFYIKFSREDDLRNFHNVVKEVKNGTNASAFTERTEESSASQYFQFYGYLSQQHNMLQDYVRTSTYQEAVLSNSNDFEGKVVLDVGAGSGILSFFAAQAGAKKVYAVEASSMAKYAETLVHANGLKDRITVIAGKVEEISLPEPVDIIISEPMGYMLYNERMLETYLHAKKWLKPNGLMFPSRGDLHIAPFMDEALYMEQFNKANFWAQTSFHHVDLSSMRDAALKEYFKQPIVDTFDIRICLAKSIRHVINFQEANEEDLHNIHIPVEWTLMKTGTIHGLAFWFDVAFIGSTLTVWLSTAPTEALTHWYQVRCLLESPLFGKQGEVLKGNVILAANQRQSYDVTIDLMINNAPHTRTVNVLDLKNPFFRYSGQPVAPPPSANTTSPSENYWTTLDQTQPTVQSVQTVRPCNIMNGIPVNGLGEIQVESLANPNVIIQQQVPVPSIHPGSISSTGRQRSTTATSTVSSQLIGGGIAPALFTQTAPSHQIIVGAPAMNNSYYIGDYVAAANPTILATQGFTQ